MSCIHSAIINGHQWVEKFTQTEYKKTFESYCLTFEDKITNEIMNCSDPEQLCVSFFEELKASRKNISFWNRSTAYMDEKMVIVTYFIPMLLASSNDKTVAFAEIFRTQWSEHFPKDAFNCASFDVLNKGFRRTILGFNVDNIFKKKDEI